MDKKEEGFLVIENDGFKEIGFGYYSNIDMLEYTKIPIGRLTLGYIAKLKEFEGLRLKAYKPAGEKATANYTIGYGHHKKWIKPNEVINEDFANYLLARDLSNCYAHVESLFIGEDMPLLRATKMCALVDFVFNLGIGALERSTLWRKIKANPSDPTIPNEFRKWVYSGKRKLPGLVKRCEYRVELWNKE